MEKLGFVIVNYNDYKTTRKLLNNIKDYKCIDLIVIVDNNSKDDSFKKLQKFDNKKIKVVKNTDNSYASGLNYGAMFVINKLKSCNIIFSNSDIIIKDEKDLIKLNESMKGSIGVMAPVINEHGNLSRGWMLPTINDEILFNLPYLNRRFKKKILYLDDYYKKEIVPVDVVSGCFFMVNSKALLDASFFDTNTHLYYEENIFSKKLQKTKYREAINTSVEVLHDHSVTIDKSFKRVNKYKILKNSQRYFVEYYLEANKFQLFLLLITNKISLLVSYILGLFRI